MSQLDQTKSSSTPDTTLMKLIPTPQNLPNLYSIFRRVGVTVEK